MKSIAQIAAELQGYDPQALSADQVSAFLERLALPVTATEELGIFEALGRVLARDGAGAPQYQRVDEPLLRCARTRGEGQGGKADAALRLVLAAQRRSLTMRRSGPASKKLPGQTSACTTCVCRQWPASLQRCSTC